MTSYTRPRWMYYGFAVVATALMLVLRLGITVTFGERPLLILFILPIILSAALGGLGPGLVATLIAAVSAAYFMPPVHQFAIALPFDQFQWAMLILDGLLLSVLIEGVHRARKRAEVATQQQAEAVEALRQREAALEQAQHMTRMGSWQWDAATGRTAVSREWHCIYGMDNVPTFDERKGSMYAPETWELLSHARQQALQHGVSYDLEVPAHRADGADIWIHTRCDPVRDAAGTIVGLRGTVQDITERKRQEREIAESNARLSQRMAELAATLGRIKRLEGLLSICMGCKKIRAGDSDWQQLEKYIIEHSDAAFSHGLCPDCLATEMGKLDGHTDGSVGS